jgi:hypothetical protein
MTAPDQRCINVKKLLPIRRRPHMTLVRIDPYSEGFEQWVFECGCGETLKQIKKIK